MRALSDFPRRGRVFIIVGSVFVAVGVWGIFNAYFTVPWWFAVLNKMSHVMDRVRPVDIIALVLFLVWATRSGRLRNVFHMDDETPLSRSRTDRKILGVCGGFAQHQGLDSTVIRIAVLLLLIAFPLVTTIVYLLYAAFIQLE